MIQKEIHNLKKRKKRMNAQLVYVFSIAWFVAAVGCFIRGIGSMAIIFVGMGLLHLIWAIVRDVKESKLKKE